MQEEVSQKTIALTFNGVKVTGRMLRAALRNILRMLEKHQQKTVNHDDGIAVKRGKQRLRDLQEQGVELTNIEITKDNIGSFQRYARKYGIDYSLKMDKARNPPRYFVFFKARDADAMKAAFTEYTASSVKKEKPSVRKKLEVIKKRKPLHRECVRQKTRERPSTL